MPHEDDEELDHEPFDDDDDEELSEEELDELLSAGDHGQFIDGIFNYCDRWCERCAFTSRCRNYDFGERLRKRDGAVDEQRNDNFWREMSRIFTITRQILKRWFDEQGLDFEAAAAEAEAESKAAREKNPDGDALDRVLDKHPLMKAAYDYATASHRWFVGKHDDQPLAREDHDNDAVAESIIASARQSSISDSITVADAIEVVRWYQFFITAKITRALSKEDDDLMEIDEVRESMMHDANGSAKVALIAIDRSLAAWNIVRDAMGDRDDRVVKFMMDLSRLRRGLEAALPQARAFRRPGFDDAQP